MFPGPTTPDLRQNANERLLFDCGFGQTPFPLANRASMSARVLDTRTRRCDTPIGENYGLNDVKLRLASPPHGRVQVWKRSCHIG